MLGVRIPSLGVRTAVLGSGRVLAAHPQRRPIGVREAVRVRQRAVGEPQPPGGVARVDVDGPPMRLT